MNHLRAWAALSIKFFIPLKKFQRIIRTRISHHFGRENRSIGSSNEGHVPKIVVSDNGYRFFLT